MQGIGNGSFSTEKILGRKTVSISFLPFYNFFVIMDRSCSFKSILVGVNVSKPTSLYRIQTQRLESVLS